MMGKPLRRPQRLLFARLRTSRCGAGARASTASVGDLNEPTLYDFLLGEIALQRGDLPLAAKTYLELAKRTRDPRIARRAVEVANQARLPELALEAARTWHDIEPASAQALQVLAALLVARQARRRSRARARQAAHRRGREPRERLHADEPPARRQPGQGRPTCAWSAAWRRSIRKLRRRTSRWRRRPRSRATTRRRSPRCARRRRCGPTGSSRCCSRRSCCRSARRPKRRSASASSSRNIRPRARRASTTRACWCSTSASPKRASSSRQCRGEPEQRAK